jgi:hypothetical protein
MPWQLAVKVGAFWAWKVLFQLRVDCLYYMMEKLWGQWACLAAHRLKTAWPLKPALTY